MGRVLVIDDDQNLSSMLVEMIRRMGHVVVPAFTLEEGLREALSNPYDVVFLDVGMPDGNGLDLITQIKQCPSSPEVIIITALGNPDGAEDAIEKGAWDYIEKPSSLAAMTLPLIRALQYREVKVVKKITLNLIKDGIIGDSNAMKACLNQIADAADSDANVLICGETGTGKELFAWAIHNNSSRSAENFVVVDCAAISDTLVESMLFGYEKGSFTGADKSRSGLILQADGGTLFLDEIGELTPMIQKSFLRVLQEKRFRPIGCKNEVSSNFRLIAATNKDLDEMVQQGSFRSDLLFRIRSLCIEPPPLRKRTEDIRDIAIFHMSRLCKNYGIKPKTFSPEFMDSLISYDWPGNIRELINTMERVITVAREQPVLFAKHLPKHIRIKIARASLKKGYSVQTKKELPAPQLPKLSEFRENAVVQAEKDYLLKLMSLSSGSIHEACRAAGLSRSRLYELLKKHKIKPLSDLIEKT